MASSSFFSSLLTLALASTALAAPAKPKTAVLFLGDSLTVGLGVEDAQAYPALIGARWKKERLPWTPRVFAAIGGESSDLRDSLDFTLGDDDLALVVVLIGGNDMFRKIPPAQVRANVDLVLAAIRKKGLPALLVRMKADPADDAAYAEEFDRIFPDLASKHGVPLAPFVLNGIVKNRKLTVDRIHPNARGHRLVAERLYPYVMKALGP